MLKTTAHSRAYMTPEDHRYLVTLTIGHDVTLSAKHPKGPYCARRRVSGSEPHWAASPVEAVQKALAEVIA